MERIGGLDRLSDRIREMSALSAAGFAWGPSARERAEAEASRRAIEEDRRQTAVAFAARYAVPSRFAAVGYGDLERNEATAAAIDAAGSVAALGRGLILSGDVGAGKSMLAAAIVNDFVGAGLLAAFLRVEDLYSRLRDFDGGPQVRRDMARADVLVLDDLGQDRPAEWGLSQLVGIVDDRWRDGKPIVATCNLSMRAMRQHYMRALAKDQVGTDESAVILDRLFSRLMAGTTAIVMRGADFRTGKAEA